MVRRDHKESIMSSFDLSGLLTLCPDTLKNSGFFLFTEIKPHKRYAPYIKPPEPDKVGFE